MKRIGDVMKHISIPIGPDRSGEKRAPDLPQCSICNDAGYVRAAVAVGHPMFGKLIECRCRRESTKAASRLKMHEESNLPGLDRYDFEHFDPSVSGVSDSFDEAFAYARNPDGWLFLHGGVGVGKTHLAVAIARYAFEHQEYNVYFQVVPDLLDQLRSTFDPANGVAYDERFQQIRDSPLLILDDLGTENTTPWAREKLYQLFNYRYNERLPTVVTSNQDLKMIDERVASRLLDTRLTTVIEVDAEDFRRRGRADYVRGRRR